MKMERLGVFRIKAESASTTAAKMGVQRLKTFLMALGLSYILYGQYYKVGEVNIQSIIERSFKNYTFEVADSAQLVATLYTPASPIMEKVL